MKGYHGLYLHVTSCNYHIVGCHDDSAVWCRTCPLHDISRPASHPWKMVWFSPKFSQKKTCLINGHFRNLNWRHLPYCQAYFLGLNFREYPHNSYGQKYGTYLQPEAFGSSILDGKPRWRSMEIHRDSWWIYRAKNVPQKYPPNMVFHGVFHSFSDFSLNLSIFFSTNHDPRWFLWDDRPRLELPEDLARHAEQCLRQGSGEWQDVWNAEFTLW